jgi:hypothetical protein
MIAADLCCCVKVDVRRPGLVSARWSRLFRPYYLASAGFVQWLSEYGPRAFSQPGPSGVCEQARAPSNLLRHWYQDAGAAADAPHANRQTHASIVFKRLSSMCYPFVKSAKIHS